jgi:serine protease AprX
MYVRTLTALILLALVAANFSPITSVGDKSLDASVEKLITRSTPPYSQDGLNSRFIVLGGIISGDLKALVERSGGKVVKELGLLGGLVVEGPTAVAEMLKHRGYSVYRDRVVYLVEPLRLPFDSMLNPMLSAGTPAIGAPRLVAMGYDGSGVKVAVIDTGIENLHPWLMRGNESVVGWEVDATGTGVEDYCGKRIGYYWGGMHGTHVAGIIASQYEGAPGVAPGAILYDVIVFPEAIDSFLGCFSTLASYVLAGIELALLGPDMEPDTGDEADVLSLSLGYTAPPEVQYAIKAGIIRDPVIEALEKAVEKGKVVAVAAGNDYGLNMVNALCLAEGVICVGASSHMGTGDPGDDVLAWFSSKGPGPLGTMLPHVVAPGVYIYSSIPTELAKQLWLPEPGDLLSGTSMATPFVSGSAALLISYIRSKGGDVDPRVVAARLIQTATDVKPQDAEAFWLLPDFYKELLRSYIPVPPANTPVDQGGGLINVFKAALAELELSIEGGPLGYIILKEQPYSFNITIKNVAGETLSVAASEALIKFWNIYTFEDVSDRINLYEGDKVYRVGNLSVNITINVLKLNPGIYGGYIGFRVVESEQLYRIPVILVVPVNIADDRLRFLEQLKLATGTRDVWDVLTLYVNVEEPVAEPLAVATLSSPGASGMISVTLTTPSGSYSSFTNTMGYILLEPGLYTLSAWILFGFGWPINVEFTLTLGMPTLTERVRGALEDIQLLSSRVALIEASLNATIRALEILRLELQAESQLLKGRIDVLNRSLAELDIALKGLEGELSRTRAELDIALKGLEGELSRTRDDLGRVSATLSNVNTTLSQRIAEEARRLGNTINLLDTRLQQARGDLEALRGELNTRAQELSSRIDDLGGAHSTTRVIAMLATLIGLVAGALGAYGVVRSRST